MRSLFVFFIFTFLSFCHATHAEDAVIIPFEKNYNAPVIKLELGAQKYGLFLLDTGSPFTVLNSKQVKDLHLNKLPEQYSMKAAGIDLVLSRNDYIALKFQSLTQYVSPLIIERGMSDSQIEKLFTQYPDLTGIVGLDFFCGKKMKISRREGAVYVSSSSRHKSQKDICNFDNISTIHRPLFRTKIDDRELNIFADTGSLSRQNIELTDETVVSELWKNEEVGSFVHIREKGIVSKVILNCTYSGNDPVKHMFVIPNPDLRDETAIKSSKNTTVHGYLGWSGLRHGDLEIDTMQPENSRFTLFEKGGTGYSTLGIDAAFLMNSGGMRVDQIVEGSPAWNGGLTSGSIITSFDGIETTLPNASALGKAAKSTKDKGKVELVWLENGVSKRAIVYYKDYLEKDCRNLSGN